MNIASPTKKSYRRALVASAAGLFLLLPYGAIAASSDVVKVSDAWARETAPGQSVGAAYMRMRSEEDLTLVGIASTASKTAELHQMSMKGDLMQMREVKTVKLSPGVEFALQPGGTHVMLVDLGRPLKAGGVVALKLTFRRPDGSTFVLPVTARVRSVSAEAMHAH